MNASIPLFIILLILSAGGTSMSFANPNNQQATSADNDGAAELPRHVRPPLPKRPPKANNPNVYLGLGSDGGIDGSRRSKGNRELTAKNIKKHGLKEAWKFDTADAFPELAGGDVLFSRLVGPLSTPQADEDVVYFNIGTNWTVEDAGGAPFINPSKIVALHRDTGDIKWVADYFDIVDKSLLMLADKFPDEYNSDEIQAYLDGGGRAGSGFVGSFGPIAVFDDYIVTGESASSSEVRSLDYLKNDVKQNPMTLKALRLDGKEDLDGNEFISPVLGKEWGMRDDNPHRDANARRHLLRNTIMLLDKETGELLAVDRYADAGEDAANNYVQVTSALRMATPFLDSDDGKKYIIAGNSITAQFNIYTPYDSDLDRIAVAIKNDNVPTQKGGRLTKFLIDESGAEVELVEEWRFYTVPEPLEAGDVNPFNGTTFKTNVEADAYNYHFDGVWMQRPAIDLERRQTCFGTGNGHQMPIEDIRLARDPSIATAPNSYPERNWQDWELAFKAASDAGTGSVAAQNEVFESLRQTNEDMRNVLETVTVSRPSTAVDRYKQYLANAVSCVDLDTGEFNWTWRRAPVDTWFFHSFFSVGRPVLGYDEDFMNSLPEIVKWTFVGLSGDLDFGIGPIHVKRAGLDIYVAVGKDGSMQGLNPDTGEVLWYTHLAHPKLIGAFNYGATTDGRNVYATAVNTISPLNIVSLIAYQGDIVAGEPVISLVRGAADIDELLALGPDFGADGWYTNRFRDTHNDLGGGAAKLYVNQEVLIPSGNEYIVSVKAHNGSKVTMASVDPFGSTPLEVINRAITSTADVLLVPGAIGGKFYIVKTKGFEKVFEFDTRDDTADLLDPEGFETMLESPAIPVGKDIFFGPGEISFFGTFPGKFFYRFCLDDGDCDD